MTTTPGGDYGDSGVFCCVIADDYYQVVLDCIEYHEWEAVAASLCAAATLLTPGATGSQLSEGPCSELGSCQYYGDKPEEGNGGW